MNFFEGMISNYIFWVALASWFAAQFGKVVVSLIAEKRLDWSRLIGSGGLPSSHSSLVMGMSTAIGLRNGFDSPFYAIALVLALIVMYDASGVRRAVGTQAAILNQMINDLYAKKPIAEEKLKELIGHTPFEVLAGAILGIIIANLMC